MMEPGHRPELPPGSERRIGKYRVIELVGRGAMGKVYAAHDDDTDRKVAIKVLMADLESEPEIRARFFREAQAAARLRHRNVITIYDVGEDHGRPFIVMELLRGRTLDAYMSQAAPIDLERKVDVMIQVCDAMAAAHAAEIIHRDLKPGNLFVQFDGLLKVLDFGVARLASSSMTTAGAQPGTVHFMSPEQARGENIDSRSDVFSAGGVFYFMLTGRKPFPGDEWARVIRMLQFEDPVALTATEAPPALAAIVMRSLAKDAAARYQSFQNVATDLTKFHRQYQADTRRLAESCGATYKAVLAKLTSARNTAHGAGETLAVTSQTVEQLHDAYPMFRDRGFEAFKLIPFTRTRIVALQDELARELARLDQYEQTLGELATLMAVGEEAIAEGSYHAAVRAFERILAVVPESVAARDGLTRCRLALAEREAVAHQVKTRVREAQAAARSEDWERVVVICDQILKIDRTVPLAFALREAGRSAIDVARRQADEKHLQEAIAECIRTARAAFRRGRCDDALADLQAFLSAQPMADEVQQELNRLTAVATLQASEAATRADEVRRHRDSARASLETGALEAAILAAHKAVECDPADHASVLLLCEAIDREGAVRIENERQRIAAQRNRAAESLLEVARAALTRGDLVRAASTAENAHCLAASSSGATEVLQRARSLLASDGSDDSFEEVAVATVPPSATESVATVVHAPESREQFGAHDSTPERPRGLRRFWARGAAGGASGDRQ